jgi:hypothetical protein
MVVSFLSAAFSSAKVCSSRLTISFWPRVVHEAEATKNGYRPSGGAAGRGRGTRGERRVVGAFDGSPGGAVERDVAGAAGEDHGVRLQAAVGQDGEDDLALAALEMGGLTSSGMSGSQVR